MRAIIIEEDRFAEIAEKMRHEATALKGNSYLQKVTGLEPSALAAVIDEVHRSMHFHFVRWAQSQGASCVRS